MDSNMEKIIEKVRKLLARADEARNDNPHEREIAMRQAHAMLAMHGLEMAQVGDVDAQTNYLGALVKGTFAMRTRGVWEAGIYDQVAKLNGCKSVREPARNGNPSKVYIFGRKVRAEVIRQMTISVVDSIIREARKTDNAVVSFGIGAWSGVAEQVRGILASMGKGQIDGQQLSGSMALMVIDQHKQSLIESARIMHDAFPRLGKGGSSRARDSGAYAAGRDYGSRIGLNGQIGHGGNKRLAA